jgi:hypothetical protein
MDVGGVPVVLLRVALRRVAGAGGPFGRHHCPTPTTNDSPIASVATPSATATASCWSWPVALTTA